MRNVKEKKKLNKNSADSLEKVVSTANVEHAYFSEKNKKAIAFLKKHPIPEKFLK